MLIRKTHAFYVDEIDSWSTSVLSNKRINMYFNSKDLFYTFALKMTLPLYKHKNCQTTFLEKMSPIFIITFMAHFHTSYKVHLNNFAPLNVCY